MQTTGDKYFYQKLAHFADFKDITSDVNFHSIPRDWLIVITDIIDSTSAIEKGQYKDVNTIGAASIVSAHNAIDDIEFPYVFGGDGATFLAPMEYRDKIEKELKALKEIAKRGFNLDLRIGILTVEEILAEGGIIEIAKFKLRGEKSVAIFRGGGIGLAEQKLKQETEKYQISGRIKHMVDLKNLSCRWNAIPAKRGKNLSLIVQVNDESNMHIYDDLLKKLEELYNGKLENANPVNFEKMSYKSFSECYKNEKRLHTSIWSFAFIGRIINIFISVLLFKIGIPKKIFDPTPYARSMGTHSDYRKFDDKLLLSIDCSPKQIDQIKAYLKDLHKKDQIKYGMHISNNTIMTCFVNGLGLGKHIHFIDGDSGGFAMAAKKFKKQ
jgi:hypothetical protein